MASKLLINGQLFYGRSEIQSFSTQQQGGSGIEVNWGGGDIDVLTGETYQFVNHVVGGMWEYSSYRTHWLSGANKCGYQKAIRTLTATSWAPPTFGTFQAGSPPPDPEIDWEQATQANTQDQGIWSYTAGSTDSRCDGTKRWQQRRNGSIVRTLDTCISAYAFFETRTFPKVLTNTGQTSVRQTGVTPLVRVLGNECNLVITYTDGKTQTLIYSECPTVAPFEDEICPQACDKANQILNRLRG
ncbi:hypothetical protein [Picosynechococcus sp. PCC 8807]|uniref:hypothetical protein n=1 Tax=Picosynechococcus sp. PCC 8807 TaxID=195248 RepID=UPI0008107CE2|nr:hypothetical protein [Picosynechococcus sp. PCC 8807]ANV90769.1 hypothetical protein AWQ24_09070 [Picosynechococcus sp. PCC 8807]